MVSRWEEHDGCEALIATVFPGPLNPTAKVRIREVSTNMLNNWTSFDYDEVLGGIPVGVGVREDHDCSAVVGIYAPYLSRLLRVRIKQRSYPASVTQYVERLLSGSNPAGRHKLGLISKV